MSCLRAVYVGLLILTFVQHAHSSAFTSTESEDMADECVGRIQFRIPKNFDIAANSASMVLNDFSHPLNEPNFEFTDGEDAGYSIQNYFGSLIITHSITAAQKDAILAASKKSSLEAQARAKRLKYDADGRPLIFEHLAVGSFAGEANHINGAFRATIFLGDHALIFTSESAEQEWSDIRIDYQKLLNSIHSRAVGEVPQAAGVCLPYTFIQDDGKMFRAIGTTYRLQAHPDITIWMEDSNSDTPEAGMDPKKFTADHDNEFFWGGRYQDFSKGHLLWFEPHSVKLNGVKGVSTFMELTRQDGTIDYGYFAASRGNRKTADSSDLKMYVIRDSKNAISKGIKPMDKDDFIKLAETIAASVKQRPTGAH